MHVCSSHAWKEDAYSETQRLASYLPAPPGDSQHHWEKWGCALESHMELTVSSGRDSWSPGQQSLQTIRGKNPAVEPAVQPAPQLPCPALPLGPVHSAWNPLSLQTAESSAGQMSGPGSASSRAQGSPLPCLWPAPSMGYQWHLPQESGGPGAGRGQPSGGKEWR